MIPTQKILKVIAPGLLLSGILSAIALFAPGAQAGTVTLDVRNGSGAAITDYRWLVEEDNTHPATPGVHSHSEPPWKPGRANDLSLGIHMSHAPVFSKGCVGDDAQASDGGTCGGSTITLPDDGRRFFISVLPYSGNTLSGAAVSANYSGTVNVHVNAFPVPTAQITVLAYNDNNPINAEPNLPQERASRSSSRTALRAAARSASMRSAIPSARPTTRAAT